MEKILLIAREKTKLLLAITFLITVIFFGVTYFKYYQNTLNNKISEKYIEAGIYLSKKDKETSKKIFKEIIQSENNFYSVLALNNIIENDLEQSSEEVLRLFKIVENTIDKKEQEDLIKLKKALYYLKISKAKEGNNLLKEIIASDSIWKETAIQTLKFN
jgi:predicted negative regulator of RcsB-dependent stress response